MKGHAQINDLELSYESRALMCTHIENAIIKEMLNLFIQQLSLMHKLTFEITESIPYLKVFKVIFL